jgi:hypothetical protein
LCSLSTARRPHAAAAQRLHAAASAASDANSPRFLSVEINAG